MVVDFCGAECALMCEPTFRVTIFRASIGTCGIGMGGNWV